MEVIGGAKFSKIKIKVVHVPIKRPVSDLLKNIKLNLGQTDEYRDTESCFRHPLPTWLAHSL